MADLWQRISNLQGRTVPTVTGKRFTVDVVDPDSLKITLESTGKSRPIPRYRFERAWPLKQAGRTLRPVTIQRAGVSNINAPYVAAILNAVDVGS